MTKITHIQHYHHHKEKISKITCGSLLFFLLLICDAVVVKAQTIVGEISTDVTLTKEFMTVGNYKLAIQELELLHRTDAKNPEWSYNLGICYIETHEKEKAIPHFEAAAKANHGNDVLFWLARAYHLDEQYDNAIKTFKNYLEGNYGSRDLLDATPRQIDMCEYAKQMIKSPLNIEIKNMGSEVNSEAPDYLPYVTPDEGMLIFNSRRSAQNIGMEVLDGWYTTDVFYMEDKKGNWSKAKNMGPMTNTAFDEEVIALSPDGTVMLLNISNLEIVADIFISHKKGKRFEKFVEIPGAINTPGEELSACINSEKTMIIFSSDRSGTTGGSDLFTSKLLPNGLWGQPELLSTNINTVYNEMYPILSADEKTLYFASEGHKNMGGYDIFYSTYDSDKEDWSTPINIGYPINTPLDEYMLSFAPGGKRAYFSSDRKGSIGYNDLWEVHFNEVEEKQSLVFGTVKTMVAIDYNTYVNVVTYQKGDNTFLQVPENEKVPDLTGWEKINTKEMVIKPGQKLISLAIFEKEGKEVKRVLDKAPFDDPSYVFKTIQTRLSPDPQYIAPKKQQDSIAISLKDYSLEVYTLEDKQLVGVYKPGKSGKYVVIVEPGSYEMEFTSAGFHSKKEKITILGRSSFRDENEVNINLVSTTPRPPMTIKELKEMQKAD